MNTIGWWVGTKNLKTAIQKYYTTQKVGHGSTDTEIVNTQMTGRKNLLTFSVHNILPKKK